MPALSHEAHEGSCWSHRFFRSRQRLQALTLRKVLEAEGVMGDAGLTVDEESKGEGLSPSWEDSSKERLRLLIRAHGRKPAGFGLVGLASFSPSSLQTDGWRTSFQLPPHWSGRQRRQRAR
jgi:hypothetical protein